jgi:hypothetical protein
LASKVKIVGGTLDGSELENAASEATLKLLLEATEKLVKAQGVQAKKANKEIKELGDAAKDTSEDARELGQEFRTLGGDLKWLASSGFRLLGQSLISLVSGVNSASRSLVSFGADMISTQPQITDFTEALSGSAVDILGLGTAVHRLTEMVMTNYRSFQTLSQSGIFFGDRISTLQTDFAALGVDANTLTSALAENSRLFAMYGSASSAAAIALDGMREGMRDTRMELLSYGVSLEEQTEIFTSMYARNTRALRLGLVTTNEINQQSARYAKSLRTISELTGIQARELEEQQKRLDMENAFQLYLDSLNDPDLANRIRENVAAVGAALGDGGRDMAMAQAMGTVATTDAAIALQGYGTNITQYVQDMDALSREMSIGTEEGRRRFLESTVALANAQELGMDRNLALSQQLIFGGETIVGDLLGFVRTFRGSVEDAESRLGEVDESGRTLMTLEDAIIAIREGFSNLSADFLTNPTVQAGIANFREWISSFSEWLRTANFDDFFTSIFGGSNIGYGANQIDPALALAAGIEEVRIPSLFERLMDPESRQEIIDSIKEFLSPILGDIGTFLYEKMAEGISYLWNEISLSSYVTAMVAGIAALWAAPAVVAALKRSLLSIGGGGGIDLPGGGKGGRWARLAQQGLRLAGSAARFTPLAAGAAVALTPSELGDGTISGPIQQQMAEEGLTVESMGFEEWNRELEARIQQFNDTASESVGGVARDYIESLINSLHEEQDRINRSLAGENVYWGRDSVGREESEARILDLENQIRAAIEQERINNGYDLSDMASQIPQRKIGTLRATGRTTEPADTVAKIHAGERVLNPDEASAYNNSNTESQRDVVKKLEELNTSMQTLVRLMTQELAIQSRTMNTISGLGPDLMKGIPS